MSCIVLIFSKDRALQLDATIRSFLLHCKDADEFETRVLFKTSSDLHAIQYEALKNDYQKYPFIQFIKEENFRLDVIALIAPFDYVLFLVDDTIFIRDFSLRNTIESFSEQPRAIGVSLRLGSNTIYCYSLDKAQRVPDLQSIGKNLFKYDWTKAEHDFGYPLEVSSSLYRAEDIIPFIAKLEFKNPNTLEYIMASNKSYFQSDFPEILCFEESVAFSAPMNIVQTEWKNRANKDTKYTTDNLAAIFSEGKRIDINEYINFIPNACHQEVRFKFIEPIKIDEYRPPMVSIVIPCYNQAHFLNEAVESVVNQTFQDWECIIVNDGSPDNTSEVARELISKYPDKKIILAEKQNGGLADARNFGIKNSRGKYILPLDADDKILPEMLENTVDLLENNPEIAIAYTDTIRFGSVNDTYPTGEYDLKRLSLINILNYCSLFRRKAWEAVGGYNTKMLWGYEDWDFWIACGEKGFFGKRVPKLLFMYRIKGDSMLTNAYKHDIELKAQIVLNHPNLYSLKTIKWAEKMLSKISNNEPVNQPRSLLCRIPVETELDSNGMIYGLYDSPPQKRLSIVHINTDDIAGGAAKVAWRLSETQRLKGHSSKMLVKNKWSNSDHSVSIPYEVDAALHESCYREGWLDYEFQKSYELVNHPLIQSSDIVHFHNLHGGYFSPFAISSLSHFKPVVWTLHDMQSFTGHCAHSFECEKWQTGCGNCPDLTIYPGLAVDSTSELWKDKKFIYEHSRLYIVVPSKWLKDKVEKSILGNQQIELIYNGVDTEVFRPYPKDKARKEFGLPADKLLFGNISNGGVLMSTFKGGEYVLKAMEKMRESFPDCEFLNIGASGDSGMPYVRNIPPVNDEKELAKLYSSLDIFLFTSLAENCPLAVLEAMSCGLPVVSFATGGVPEIIRDGIEGLVVETKDTDALISSLTGLAFSPDLREQFGKSARQRVCEMFDIKKISEQYEDLYLRIEEAERQRHVKINLEIDKIQSIIESGELKKANELLVNAVNRYPDSPDLNYMQAEVNVKSGNIARGKAILLDLVRLWPMNYVFLSNLALIYWEEGNYKIAEEYFIEALKASRFNRSVVLPYSQMLLNAGDITKARRLFETYLKIDPYDNEILSLIKKTEGILQD